MRSEALIAKIYFTKIPSSARVLESLPLSEDCYFWRLTVSSMKLNFSMQGLLYWEDGGESPTPTTSWKFIHSPQPGKLPRIKLLSPPTKWQFSCYNPIKTSLLAVVVVPVRAYCRNLGLCSILTRSSIFLKKNYMPPSPIQSLFQVFYIKTKLCIIFGKEGSVRQLNAICCF